jgi:glutamate formiminotransferase
MSLLMAVPNISEGRDEAVVRAVGHAYEQGGARLLDTHIDPDHHRAVHTLAGEAGHLAQAVAAGAAKAIELIDLNGPRGLHPFVGVLDIAPIVFLDEQRRPAAEAEALELGRLLGDLGLPVHLYGALGDGTKRADIRKAPNLFEPSFGPHEPHPTAGRVLVAARPPLIAFNAELAAPATLDDAKRIARMIREGGAEGLTGVRALGLVLEHRDHVAQVTMNIEDHRATPLANVVRAIERHAKISECELVGLAPRAAFDGWPSRISIRNRRTIEDALARALPFEGL